MILFEISRMKLLKKSIMLIFSSSTEIKIPDIVLLSAIKRFILLILDHLIDFLSVGVIKYRILRLIKLEMIKICHNVGMRLWSSLTVVVVYNVYQ